MKLSVFSEESSVFSEESSMFSEESSVFNEESSVFSEESSMFSEESSVFSEESSVFSEESFVFSEESLTSLASVMISGMKFTFNLRMLPTFSWRECTFSMMKILPDTDICFCWTCNQSSHNLTTVSMIYVCKINTLYIENKLISHWK